MVKNNRIVVASLLKKILRQLSTMHISINLRHSMDRFPRIPITILFLMTTIMPTIMIMKIVGDRRFHGLRILKAIEVYPEADHPREEDLEEDLEAVGILHILLHHHHHHHLLLLLLPIRVTKK